MAYKEAWTPQAHRDYEGIIEYLLKEWSTKVADNFIQDIEKQMDYVKKHPYMFPESAIKAGVRRIVVKEQVALYYRIQSDTIEVLTIFDTRQSPENLSFD